MKIGIITPVHEEDMEYFSINRNAIKHLNPKADLVLGYINKGKKLLKGLFNDS